MKRSRETKAAQRVGFIGAKRLGAFRNRIVFFVETVTSGKLCKFSCSTYIRQKHLEEIMSRDDVVAVVKKHISDVLFRDVTESEFDRSLKELGANSVDRVDIIVSALEDLAITIPLMNFAKAQSVNDVITMIHEAS